MVLLERLSSNNFENFKTLNLERFSKESYDKNFFEYYENEKFLKVLFFKELTFKNSKKGMNSQVVILTESNTFYQRV